MPDPTTIVDLAWEAAGIQGDAVARTVVCADLPRLQSLAALVHGVADAVEQEPGLVFQCPAPSLGQDGAVP